MDDLAEGYKEKYLAVLEHLPAEIAMEYHSGYCICIAPKLPKDEMISFCEHCDCTFTVWGKVSRLEHYRLAHKELPNTCERCEKPRQDKKVGKK